MQITRDIVQCHGKSDVHDVLGERTQLVACHVVPYAAHTHQLCVLGKLFLYGNTPALQLTAGYQLQSTLFSLLGKRTNSFQEIISLEKLLRPELKTVHEWARSLIVSFVEIYKYIIMLLLISDRQQHLEERKTFYCSKENLEVALKNIIKQVCCHHKTLQRQIEFHVGLCLDMLNSDVWLSKSAIDTFVQMVEFYTKDLVSPEDRRTLKENIVKVYSRFDKSLERCLLLHYLSAVLHNHTSLSSVCKCIFSNEIKTVRDTRFKPRKNLNVLICCTMLCREIFRYQGMYYFQQLQYSSYLYSVNTKEIRYEYDSLNMSCFQRMPPTKIPLEPILRVS